MSKAEERASQRLGAWDFKTVVKGKEVQSLDLKQLKEEEERAANQKEREERDAHLASLEAIPGEKLLEILNPTTPTPDREPQNNQSTKVFVDLNDFVRWYVSSKEKFSEPQKQALNTLQSISEMVTKGCKCKENERRGAAYGYYQKFIISNSETDIIDKIKEVGGFDSVSFLVAEGADPFFTA
jgi:hypothetical protein